MSGGADAAEIERLRHELQVVSLLVEHLFVTEFSRFPDGVARFERFSETALEAVSRVKIPGASPVVADHASQSWSEALTPVLERILGRLTNVLGRAS